MVGARAMIVGLVAAVLIAAGDALVMPSGAIRGGPVERVVNEAHWNPRGFEAFLEYMTPTEVCSDVEAPSVPTEIPSWAAASADELRAQGIFEVPDMSLRGKTSPTSAFSKGGDIVLKECTARALESIVWITRVVSYEPDPEWDIYFDCDPSSMWTIKSEFTLHFGDGRDGLAGTFRLLAPHFNVILSGDGTRRIMEIQSGAQVTAYGIKFERGEIVNMKPAKKKDIPSGGWSGGAALVNGAFTAYKCKFVDNRAESYHARWAGGGAIKFETGSFGFLWGCEFSDNRASVGGAVATSSAAVLYVRDTTFHGNKAYGGVDGNDINQGAAKPRILVRGGAMRVDSALSYVDSYPREHVALCNCDFVENATVFPENALQDRFHFTDEDDVQYVRAKGGAVTLWNRKDSVNHNAAEVFAAVVGCTFSRNWVEVGSTERQLGRYVLEAEGAGNFALLDTTFEDNTADRAVVRVNNSSQYDDGVPTKTTLKNLRFTGNGEAHNFEFEKKHFQSHCEFVDVDSFEDGVGTCWQLGLTAEENGGNVSV